MKTLPSGFGLMALILAYALADVEAAVFLNFHSFALVVLGTFAVLLLTTPSLEMKSLLLSFKALFKNTSSNDSLYLDVIALSKNKLDPNAGVGHGLFLHAQHLWKQGVDSDVFETMMIQKSEEMSRIYETAVAVLRNLAKYPPALGMTGTVMGLVSVFSQMAASGKTNVGPAHQD